MSLRGIDVNNNRLSFFCPELIRRQRRKMIPSAILIPLYLSLSTVPADRAATRDKSRKTVTVPLLNPDALPAGRLSNPEKLPVKCEFVDVKNQPFKKALQVTTDRPTAEWWAIQYVMRAIGPVAKGDVLLAAFHMRCVDSKDETGEAYVRAVFQAAKSFNKSLMAQFGAGRRWRKVTVPFTVVETTKSGESIFNFAFPAGPQIVQIGGVTLENHGAAVSESDLPKSLITYAGRELDAPWREEARKRIDELRKADLRVVVSDREGKPVPGARVLVNMTRHGFPFGTAVQTAGEDGHRWGSAYGKRHTFTSRDEEQYDYWLKRWFTKATPEVALMPNGWTNVWPNLGRKLAIEGVKKYHAMGYDIRGHILVWPGWKWFRLPGIEEVKNDPEKLGKMVLEHITDETATLKEWINEWTLLNEPFAHHDLMDVLGDDAMIDWFNAGHAANPNARLYINDYSILSGGGVDLGHQEHYAKTIKFLLDKGAPLHGIGMQGHFGEDPTAPGRVYQILERFAAFGKEMQVTEFDINTRDNQLQADYTRDFMTVCFSHPSIVAFSFWGFWENAHWRPDAALIDKDWKLKPSGEAYEQLVLNEWWTQEEGTADMMGVYSIRGFLGDYRITVLHRDASLEVTFKLKPGKNILEVNLGAEPAVGVKVPGAKATS